MLSHLSTLLVSIMIAAGITCQPGQDDLSENLIVINEFLTSNKSCLGADEAGDCDDWIELYNTGKEPVSLKNISCSDDSTNLYRYTFPDTSLAPGAYIVLWADDEPQEGELHAPFKLSSENGDEIILTGTKGNVLDRIQFFPHSGNPIARVPDASYGREFDGSENWVQLFLPSPGAKNSGGRK